MAILERGTNNYYKVEFDECMVKGTSVIVAFSTYQTIEDRENEKSRKPLLTAFLGKIQQRIATLYDELFAAATELGKAPEEMIDSEGKIYEALYPELRTKQDEMNSLEAMPQKIIEKFYQYGDHVLPEIDYEVSKSVLEGYGFDESWITNPIRLTTKAQIYCGEYQGEDITHEFYYNRLKTRMNNNIEDC